MEELLDIYRRMCRTRYFELEVVKAHEQGLIKCPIYLSIGQESISAAVATVISDYYILAQHRAHSVYLAFGGDPAKLRDELLGLDTGCSRGWGGSPSIQDGKIKMIGHHGLVGEDAPLAVGVALGSGSKVACFLGDGALEEDYVFSAFGFAVTHKLPVLFIGEDNDLCILTPKSVRRSWSMVDVACALGMPAIDITDDPILIVEYIKEFKLPAFINCRTCRHRWHVGTGIDAPPEWDRFAMVKEQLGSQANKIETEEKDFMEGLWKKRIRRGNAILSSME